MRTTDHQVRKLMKEYCKHGKVGRAALRAGMDRKTGAKYVASGRLPSEQRAERTWKTRKDPFAEDWPEIRQLLEGAPELEAKVVLEHLMEKHPGRYTEGHVRTLQRRFKIWRATDGPSKRVFFPQVHRPGEAIQTDFTWGNELEITLAGEPFPHLICHSVLPYSNWEWVSVCHSESMVALRRGVQETVFELGHVPEFHQTDNSTAATHHIGGGKRVFNDEYLELMRHLGMKPRTIAVGEKEQNGDVEAANGALKRRVVQLLRLRGSRDFPSEDVYEKWLRDVVRKANLGRQKRIAEELRRMLPIQVRRMPEYTEEQVSVTAWSTIRVKRNAYSVPSQLMRERVRVRIFDAHLEVYYGGRHQLTIERLCGDGGHDINYRHIIESLVRRPGAFQRYRYREDLFPSRVFRRAYDTLTAALDDRAADMEYLRVLHLAARTMESEVAAALEIMLEGGRVPRYLEVKDLVVPEKPQIPDIPAAIVDLESYDALLRHDLRETGS